MKNPLLNKLIPYLEKTLQTAPNPVVAFDADGTLWPRDVGKSFFQYQVAHKLLRGKSSKPQEKFNLIREKSGRKQALIWLAQVQAGFSLPQLNQWIQEFLKKDQFKMFPFQQNLIKWLIQREVEVFVVSSSLKWVLDQALLPYNIPQQNIIGVQTKIQGNKITNKPVLPAPIHTDKVGALKQQIQGARPFLVAGNTLADQALLEFSSHWRLAVATAHYGDRNYESEQKLLNIAIQRGWFYYDSRQKYLQRKFDLAQKKV